MTSRIVEIAESAARLNVRNSQLVIERDGCEPVTTPLEELAALVLAHPHAVLTASVVARLCEAGGTLVVSDAQHRPCAMMLPLDAHSTQAERMIRQARLALPTRKRLWQQVARAKVRAQSRLLLELHGEDGGIGAMAARVASGDPHNIEAQAARIYWPRLFADVHFRRGREGPDQNRHLNYGYAVLRALVARAVCAAGLHPSLGVHHANRYNSFCLADDIMEPFRPLVDRAVALWVREHDPTAPLDSETRAWLIAPAVARYCAGGEVRSLFEYLAETATSLARVVLGEARNLGIPVLSIVEEEHEPEGR